MATLTKAADQPLQLNEVQAFFGRLFIHSNGMALQNLGRFTANNRITWPHNNSSVLLQPGMSYVRNSTDGVSLLDDITGDGGKLSIDRTIDFSNARMDVDVEIHTLPPDGEIDIDVFAVSFGTDDVLLSNRFLVSSTSTISTTGTRTLRTVTTGALASTRGTLTTGQRLVFGLRVTSAIDLPFEYTVHAVRISFDDDELLYATSARNYQLSDFNRDGGVVPSGGLVYPATGGIAIDNLGSATMSNGHFYSWPTTAATILGDANRGTSGFTYVRTTQQSDSNPIGAIIVNNTGSSINLSTMQITLRITFTSFPVGQTTINPFFWVYFVNQSGSDIPGGFFQMDVTQTNVEQIYRFNGDALSNTWATSAEFQNLRFRIFSNVTAHTPFSYTINHLRINFDSSTEEFVPVPRLNGGVSADSTQVTLSSLRGVDDGVE